MKKKTPENEKRYTLRYRDGVPYDTRPHDPCMARFTTYGEAVDHLEEQSNADDLEVVRR